MRISRYLYCYYEGTFKKNLLYCGFYIFPKGIPYQFDGVVQPFNQVNIYALALLEWLKIENKDDVRQRVHHLFCSFFKEVQLSEEKLLWRYWPNIFYQGWEKKDNISVHKPFHPELKNRSFEDINHASINAFFLYSSLEYFKRRNLQDVFFDALNRTIKSFFLKGHRCSKALYKEFENVKLSSLSEIRSFWVFLANQTMLNRYSKGSLFKLNSPFFDGDIYSDYSYALKRLKEIGK